MAETVSAETIEQLEQEALAALDALDASADALERWRVEYLGRKGRITSVLRSLGTLPPETRRQVGASANRVKSTLEERLAAKQAQSSAAAGPGGALDITLPGRKPRAGRLHPSTQTIREICAAFNELGFQTVEGPEVEWERYNFDLLNIPADHPARDQWDTIWVDRPDPGGVLLRTHTSPMQARVMERTEPPVRVVVPGKCYRMEATDATHEWQFHQIEGLAVDEGITFADLKGTLYEFARRIFGPERRVRFRCDFFPFVEPGVDMSIDCFACSGSGCRVCRQSGWIEIMGAGMVHPKVLRGVGYDPEKYSGFAFGMGPERIAMLRHGIEDIRHFFANDLRFLSQF
ncbi:MAG: phenylalanine--tRNA ligase subunit alpha [Dehalococcoidia bacterium]